MNNKKARAPTRTELVCKALEDEIFGGDLLPGARLDELSLASRFSVSRTPVREALHQLSASGLVEVRPRQGAVVARITLRRLIELFVVMAELESLCARLSATNMTEDERCQLLESCDACGAAVAQDLGMDAYYQANCRFHDAVYEGAHNSVLAELISGLRRRGEPYRRKQLARPGRMAVSQAEHWTVARAIVKGDADAAAEAMRCHVMVQVDVIGELLPMLPSGVDE
ncbi:GntR family transcriptional regulator [Rhodospira trueperi]|uniref:DNA-binding transcriptional regulator, GntR family n=1 Tax=Rhodospira trueperi TaxID=69960 RepID=A0A1G7G0Y3_9PROT|nr:GntR family transcriptional regulator [Rhodospira trueperi]SDE81762.1 DNA-binding transcriptional regulator, GntR family [Rhodospira trueperi]